MDDLGLKRLWVVYPGKSAYPLDEQIECIGMENLEEVIQKLGN